MQSINNPLISILIPCYNNQRFIYELLDSIFRQTYRNLEVLIGDDASKDFDEAQLLQWLEKNQPEDIKRVEIYHYAVNVGTVANMEYLHTQSRGEYLFNIAADDAFYDETVLECFVRRVCAIREAGEEPLVIMAQLEMWDHELKNKLNDFMAPEAIRLVKEGTPQDIFAESCVKCFLPAQFLYHKSIIEKQGKLAGCYHLVEDWPAAIRLSRQNVRFHYMDDVPSAKHRDGGISHGNSRQSDRALIRYFMDLINCYYLEIEPYLDLLSQSQRAQVLDDVIGRLGVVLAKQTEARDATVSKMRRIKDMLKRIAKLSAIIQAVFLALFSYMSAEIVLSRGIVWCDGLCSVLTIVGHGFLAIAACGCMIKALQIAKRKLGLFH